MFLCIVWSRTIYTIVEEIEARTIDGNGLGVADVLVLQISGLACSKIDFRDRGIAIAVVRVGHIHDAAGGNGDTLGIGTHLVLLLQSEVYSIDSGHIATKGRYVDVTVVGGNATGAFTSLLTQHGSIGRLDGVQQFHRLGIGDKHAVLAIDNDIHLVAIAQSVVGSQAELPTVAILENVHRALLGSIFKIAQGTVNA